MATYYSQYSFIHGTCTVGQPFGTSGYTCGYHTGVDIPGNGTSERDLYSVTDDGYVVKAGVLPNLSAFGNEVLIYDNTRGVYWRYCHLASISVTEGQAITTSTKLGVMGSTGHSTGTHLHLECARSERWNCSVQFLNPLPQLGIPNERGTIIIFDGSPTPPPPPPPPPPDPPRPPQTGGDDLRWRYLYLNRKNIKLKP